MDTKRLLLSAAASIALCACDKWESPPDDPGIALARSQILAAPALQMHGATLNVPSATYPTIAAALGAAKSGDLVRVAAGTYQECLVLVDGVTIMGPVVPRGQPPTAALDGTVCGTGVVSGDATILHGATVKGFLILVGGKSVGIGLLGSTGVIIQDVTIENAAGPGVRASQSSFVLEHATLLGNRGSASVVVTQGSRAVLIANDIQGLSRGVAVLNGWFLNDPLRAPSQAWMFDNRIHSNGSAGLWVSGKGTKVSGFGNRYDGNLAEGVHVTGGAVYVGLRESITGNTGDGLDAFGCELLCRAAGCNDPGDPVLVQEATLATLDSATVRENQRTGVWAACGATVRLQDSTLTGNGENGAKAELTVRLDAAHMASVPSFISARNSVFSDNQFDGLWLIGKGVTGQGIGNRYEGNSWGLHVSGGARYFGARDSLIDNLGVGVSAFGHEVRCATPDCSSPEIAREESLVRLEEATVRGNFHGVVANCGATIELRNSGSSGNQDSGAVLGSTCDWGDLGLTSAPSFLSAHGTVFAQNPGWGVIAYEDSHLQLGSLADPGRNSFLGNVAGSIANGSSVPVHAQWNWFGTTSAAAIASSILDCKTAPAFGCIEYVPFLRRAP